MPPAPRDDEAVVEAASNTFGFRARYPRAEACACQCVKGRGAYGYWRPVTASTMCWLARRGLQHCHGRGSDAARQVSQLVLLIHFLQPDHVLLAEGWRVINNIISRAASLFLSRPSTLFLLAVIVIVGQRGVPFIPIQLTLISTVTIGSILLFWLLFPTKTGSPVISRDSVCR